MNLAASGMASLWFLPFAIVISGWVIWSDLAHMKIPNKAVIALVASFAVIGILVLPLDDYLWRWAQLLVVLIICFAMNAAGMMGAGDAKFAAGMALFVPQEHAITMLLILCVTMLVGFILHRIWRLLPYVKRNLSHWESVNRRDYPLGLSLGTALVFYLMLSSFEFLS